MAEKKIESPEGSELPGSLPSRSFFSGMAPKASFLFGLLSGVAAMSLVGFVVTATFLVQTKGTSKTTNGSVAGAATNQNLGAQAGDPQGNPSAIREVTSDDHVRGAKNAKITVIEYSDFQCPYCQAVHPTLQKLLADYDGKVRWVFRNYPLESIHPNARPAANAAECVAALGGNDAYWKFADTIYTDQSKMSDDYYKQVAVGIGISEKKFTDCFSSKKYDANITKDVDEGTAAGVQGTPATFINGKLVSGALPYASFKSVVDSLL